MNAANRPAIADFTEQLKTVAWEKAAIHDLIQATLAQHELKMPNFGRPLRAIVLGQIQSPSLDSVIQILGRDTVLERLESALKIDLTAE